MSETEKKCGNCRRFVPDPERPGTGWCDEWPVRLSETDVCHPYIGRPKDRQNRKDETK